VLASLTLPCSLRSQHIEATTFQLPLALLLQALDPQPYGFASGLGPRYVIPKEWESYRLTFERDGAILYIKSFAHPLRLPPAKLGPHLEDHNILHENAIKSQTPRGEQGKPGFRFFTN